MNEKRSPERADAGLQRALKITVAAMGLLIVVGLGAVIFRLAQLSSAPGADAGAASRTLTLPEGAAVRSMSLSGDKLAVHYSSPAGEGFVMVDTATGQILSRTRVAPAAHD